MGLFFAILLFLVTLICLGWAGWQVAAYKTANPLDGILGFMLWVFALIVLYSTLLSFFYALSPSLMCLLAVGGAGCTWLIARRYPAYFDASGLFRRIISRFRSIVFAREGWIPIVVFIILVIFGLFSFITALAAPEIGADNLAYHLPRLGYWLQFRAVEPFLANNPRIGTFPATGNIIQLLPVLFLRTDRFCGLVQLICCYGTGIAIFGISRKLGATVSAASLAALLWFSIPSVLGQITISLVDIIIAFFVATSVYFMLSYRHHRSMFALIAAFVSCSLAVGVKSQAAALALCIGLYCIWQCRFHKPLHRKIFMVAASISLLFLALPFYLENYFLMHSISGIDANQLIHIHPSISSLLKNTELILAPTFFWFWFPPFKNNTDIPYHNIFEASRVEGIGLIWLSVCLTSITYIVVRLFLKNRLQIKPAAIVVGFGVFFLTFILFVMRHQPSVNRFALAALPIITPASALFLDGVALKNKKTRFIFTTLIVAAVIYVMRFYALDNFLSRLVPASRPAFLIGNLNKILPLDEESRYYDALSPFAHAINEMSKAHGIRIGLLTPQYSREGFAFGNGYTNTVVPLSYNPPQTTFDLDKLQLDALWISASTGNQLQLWHVTLPKSIDVADKSWQVTTFKTYDKDFLRAHEHAVFYQDISPILSSLIGTSSDWHLVLANETGLLFAKGRDTATRVSISSVVNPNGLEQLQGHPFFWIGQGDTTIQVFASRAGTANVVADFILGPSVPGVSKRKIKVTVNGKNIQNIILESGIHAIPIPVVAGSNSISITPLDMPTIATTAQDDTRPLILGVKDLHVEASP